MGAVCSYHLFALRRLIMTAKAQLREAYDIAVENASTIKEKWNAFYRWTINECGKLLP